MIQRLVVTMCLALGLSACGPQTPEDTAAPSGTVEQSVVPTGPTVCDMDGCPTGMCAVRAVPSSSCPGGALYYRTQIVRGQTLCI
jgi:hypothetical protein